MTVLSTDTCIRANQSGLGTSSGGETYTQNGTLTASIASNEAVIQGSTGFTSVLLGTQTTKPLNFLVRVAQNHSVFDGIGPTFRSDASGANCYFVALYNGTLLFAKLVSGGFASITSATFLESLNTFYWIRVAVDSASHVQARIWADGGSEPGTWNIDTSADTTFTAAGRYGISFNGFSGGTDTVQFDHITVTDGATTINLATQAEAKFYVKANLQTQARAKFLVRLKLATTARAKFVTRLLMNAGTRAKFLINQVVAPPTHFTSVLWTTRDLLVTWVTRDGKTTWKTRE